MSLLRPLEPPLEVGGATFPTGQEPTCAKGQKVRSMRLWIEHDRLYIQIIWAGGQRLYALDPPRDLIDA